MMAVFAGRCIRNQAMHGNSGPCTIVLSPRICVPAEMPPDGGPAEATNELERTDINDCKLALCKQNPA